MKHWKVLPIENDKRLKSADVPKKGRIFQGKTWDGKDFINNWNLITKRALNWLLCVHAKPFYVRPARVCIDGMSKKQLEWLKTAQTDIEINV